MGGYSAAGQSDGWKNPIVKQGRLGSPLVEVSPFVFKNKLYLLENNQRFWDVPGAKPGELFHEDEVRIKEVASGKIVSTPLTNHGFGTVLVWNNRVYVFAGNYGEGKPWRQMTEITMTSSADLKTWSKPVTVIKAEPGEFIYNTAVCRGENGFVLLYETNDSRWPAFTFKYTVSDDLIHWTAVPDAIYGRDKYVGGPALYYEGGWYYTLYLQALGHGYETRITRSKDLVNWQDAPDNRPFVSFDPSHKNIPLLNPDVSENNASDVELCYFNGKTILYFTGSDQTTAGDLQWASYDGTPRALFEHFFEGVAPVVTTPGVRSTAAGLAGNPSDTPSGAGTPFPASAADMSTAGASFLKEDDYRWMLKKRDEMIPSLRSEMPNGVTVYSPGGYGGNVWSRDYYYIAAGAPELVPAQEIRSVVELFLSKQLTDGRVPKNVNINLEADYVCWNMQGDPRDTRRKVIHGWQPEQNRANPAATKPEADAAQFLVLLAAEYVARSNDADFAKSALTSLHNAMLSIPRSRNGLVWIDPKAPHTSYGFTDGVVKGGNELFCSLLFWQASGKMVQMAELAGRRDLQKYYRKQVKKIEKNISVLWDTNKGAFLAATEICRQVDIWGNAFLVWIDFPIGNKLPELLGFLAKNYDRYVYEGQVRHLLAGEYWEASVSWPNDDPMEKDRFQNGAYWGTPAGWVAYALAQQTPELATRLLNDLVHFYQREGIYECVGPDNYKKIENYGSSLTLPLMAINRLRSPGIATAGDKRAPVQLSKSRYSPAANRAPAADHVQAAAQGNKQLPEDSDTRPPEHSGDWAPVLIAPTGTTTAKGSAAERAPADGVSSNGVPANGVPANGAPADGGIAVGAAANGAVKAYNGAAIPSSAQLAFQERQLGAFIHFGPASYLHSDMMSVPAASVFNPARLDAEQWVKAAKSFGAKHIVLTAKHHNGYCLWPTNTTDYSVKKSPWKNGRGDVVAEFVAACRKYDVKIGLYVSGGDKHFGCTSTPDPLGQRKLVGDIDKYFPVYLEQLRELLTGYGEIDYVWFDGAYDPFGWDVRDPHTLEPLGTAYGDAIRAMVHHLQPQAVVMGGTRPDVRWSGSEQGWAPYPLWNTVAGNAWAENWVGPHNSGWIPAEANIHTRDTWFWTPGSDRTLRSVEVLTKVYLESVGRGANLLVNITPDTAGRIPVAEVSRLAEFGKEISARFGSPLATVRKANAEGHYLISLPQQENVGYIEIEEDISKGQHIQSYQVEAWINGQWKTIATGSSVGRRRLQQVDAVRTDKLRLSCSSVAGSVFISAFSAYEP